VIKEKIRFSVSVLLAHAFFIPLTKGKILFLNSLILGNFNLTKLCSYLTSSVMVFLMLNVGKQKFSLNCNNALTSHDIIALLRFLNHLSFTLKISHEIGKQKDSLFHYLCFYSSILGTEICYILI